MSFSNDIKKTDISGQSLLEVVVTIGVIVLVLVGLLSAISFGLSNAQFSRNKAQAIKYAQEAVEWLRVERETSWSTFYNSRAGSGTGLTYCLSNTATWPIPGVCSPSGVIDDQYRLFHREATLTQSGVGRVLVNIRVYWQQGARATDVTINTYLTQWQ